MTLDSYATRGSVLDDSVGRPERREEVRDADQASQSGADWRPRNQEGRSQSIPRLHDVERSQDRQGTEKRRSREEPRRSGEAQGEAEDGGSREGKAFSDALQRLRRAMDRGTVERARAVDP